MSRASVVQPPRIAVWLLDLIIPEKQAESIPGDLFEEFSDLASRSGVASARRWYWRQSVKTIAYLIVSGLCVTPWLMTGTVLGGLLLLWFGFRLPEQAIVAILRRYRGYVHVDLYGLWMFWVPCAIQIGRVLVSMFVGCIVAMTAKGREMVAAITLGFVWAALSGVGYLVWVAKHWPEYAFFLPQLVVNLISSIAIVIGAGIVRKKGSAVACRHPGA